MPETFTTISSVVPALIIAPLSRERVLIQLLSELNLSPSTLAYSVPLTQIDTSSAYLSKSLPAVPSLKVSFTAVIIMSDPSSTSTSIPATDTAPPSRPVLGEGEGDSVPVALHNPPVR